MADYWSGILRARISRRRALATTGGSAAAAALLAACGGNDSEKTGDASGLVTKSADTTKQAKRDGLMKDRTFTDVPTLNPTVGGNPMNPISALAYNTPLLNKPGYLERSKKELVPSLIEAWEWAPDGTQVTMKLRQGVKFHNKPPVNGRTMDIDDFLLTWERFQKLNRSREEVVNSLNPDAPILSLTATDARTLVLKLKEPVTYILYYFSKANATAGWNMPPKEIDSNWDPRSDMLGTGPWMMTNYTPSQGFSFKRNPDYWDKDIPLTAEIDVPIVPDYSAALSQFKAGNIYTMGNNGGPQVKQEEVLSVKQDVPNLLIYEDDLKAFAAARSMIFGWLPDGKSPFVDERVRQAVSMSYDRDLYLETFHNVSAFAAQGLPLETRWNSHVESINEGLWLDPQGSAFGPNAKNFKHDIAEAKKLLAAAGYPNGIQNVTANQVAGSELPSEKHAEVVNAFVSEIGITSKVNLVDYAKEYGPLLRNGQGQFEGWAYTGSTGGGAGEALSDMTLQYWSKIGKTGGFRGFSTTGKNDRVGDPALDGMIEKARVERDPAKLQAYVFDIQRYLGKTMYDIQIPGAATGFVMAWPCVGNYRVFRTDATQYLNWHLWVDDTKPPFKPA